MRYETEMRGGRGRRKEGHWIKISCSMSNHRACLIDGQSKAPSRSSLSRHCDYTHCGQSLWVGLSCNACLYSLSATNIPILKYSIFGLHTFHVTVLFLFVTFSSRFRIIATRLSEFHWAKCLHTASGQSV